MVCCQGEMEGKKGQGYTALLICCCSWTICLGGPGVFVGVVCVGSSRTSSAVALTLGEKQQELRDCMSGKVRVVLGKDGRPWEGGRDEEESLHGRAGRAG